MKNVGYRHLLRPTIDSLRTFFHYLQDALPARLEAMHILNCGSFFDLVLAMIKPFMRSEIIQKVRMINCAESYAIIVLSAFICVVFAVKFGVFPVF